MVSFHIGRYEDEILCDVVPMQASHMLLGRPWQFDRRVKHDGFTNKYSFVYHNKNITLVPMSPKQVFEDQLKLQEDTKKMREQKEKGDEKEKKKELSEKKDEIEKKEKKRGKKEKKDTLVMTQKEGNMCVLAKKSEIKEALNSEKPFVLLLFKEACLSTNELAGSLPSKVVSIL